jgi:hypothetical protein
VQGLWADGLGAWWPGRHPLTAAVGAGMVGLGGLGIRRLWQRGVAGSRRFQYLLLCAALYAAWVFFFQNVIHKSRHVLPLLPLLLLLISAGADALWHRGGWGKAAVLAVLGAYTAVTVVLVGQHQSPTAIAQAKAFVASHTDGPEPTRVASIPLVNTFLRNQQVDARYYSVEDSSDVRRLREASSGQTLVVGTYTSLFDHEPDQTRRFYHNPHVNRMWPEVTVRVYEHGSK